MVIIDKITQRRAVKSVQRLKPRLVPILADLDPQTRQLFWRRVDQHYPRAFEALMRLYGEHYSFYFHLENILKTVAQSYAARPTVLRQLDITREADPLWFQSGEMVGGVCYVDLFAGDLKGIQGNIPYFKELGLTYLHLMPLYKSPPINDGGYAVSSYREINPELGTFDDLRTLAKALRENGISLCLDFVMNHTSDEHEWALSALQGDEECQDMYLLFPDRTLPDRYEHHLRQIFPEHAPGNFTFRREINRWVWTTFNPFQWDLNYANPAVFEAMLSEMLYLANAGVEFLRLDAVPFLWKELGTNCENLPQVHTIIQAFDALIEIAAPAVEYKSEAVVHPDEVVKYLGEGDRAGYECDLSYNPTLMALLWEALATREVRLLNYSMQKRFETPANTSWVNYVRVHDDIGWSFADEDAYDLYIKPGDHRQFLNEFYTGQFRGSFAKGLLFNYNPATNDGRINGTCASLAGLEKGLIEKDENEIDLAIRRVLLMHSVVLSVGGIPLLYLGDELGTVNDYSYQADKFKAEDSRWVHRPYFNWDRAASRHETGSLEARIFLPLVRLINLRKRHPVFSGNKTDFLDTGSPHVLGYLHWRDQDCLLVIANFSEHAPNIVMSRFRTMVNHSQMFDLISEKEINLYRTIELQPYQSVTIILAYRREV